MTVVGCDPQDISLVLVVVTGLDQRNHFPSRILKTVRPNHADVSRPWPFFGVDGT